MLRRFAEMPRSATSAAAAENVGTNSKPRFYTRHERLILGGLAVAVALSLWEGLGRAGRINPIFLSSPSSIAVAGFKLAMSGELSQDLWVSGRELFLGYTPSPR